MIPKSFSQFRDALLEDLHRVVFDSPIKIFLGTMEEPTFIDPQLGYIAAGTRKVLSFDYHDIRDDMITEIGNDLLKLEKETWKPGGKLNPSDKPITEYHIWLYQIPVEHEVPMIRYAKKVI